MRTDDAGGMRKRQSLFEQVAPAVPRVADAVQEDHLYSRQESIAHKKLMLTAQWSARSPVAIRTQKFHQLSMKKLTVNFIKHFNNSKVFRHPIELTKGISSRFSGKFLQSAILRNFSSFLHKFGINRDEKIPII